MKNKIKEVQDYFKSKILSGDFETTKADERIVEITIDNEFRFSLWVYTECDSFSQWSSSINSFSLPEFTDEEKKLALAIFKPIQANEKEKQLKTTKLEQFNKLQSELKEAGVIPN